jgi:hypothetical protein
MKKSRQQRGTDPMYTFTDTKTYDVTFRGGHGTFRVHAFSDTLAVEAAVRTWARYTCSLRSEAPDVASVKEVK